MAEDNNTDNLGWTASEYIDHQKGSMWYVYLIIATVAVAVVVYLVTKDYFATGTVAVLAFIVATVARWKPRQIDYQLTSKGLHVGEKFYPFAMFKTFSIIHEADLSSLVFNPIKRFSPPLTIFFDDNHESQIVEIVGHHLPMEAGSVGAVDRLSRRLRF